MARAKSITAVTGVELTLTYEEAATLLDIAHVTGGAPGALLSKPAFSRRAYVDRIARALEAAGVQRSLDGSLDGSLIFDDIQEIQ